MLKQRLRNLTTRRLHTEMGHIYEDLEFITGMQGIMTHMIPNMLRSVLPWLKDVVKNPEYWDSTYSPELTGEVLLLPMTEVERDLMMKRYSLLPPPFHL